MRAFPDIIYIDSQDDEVQFYPSIFELNSRYLIQKLHTGFQVMLQHSPAILTALGILFTFIGLIQGIVEIDLEGSSSGLLESMSHLVSGVGLAFHSSVGGLLLSFIMLIITRHEIQAADKLAKEVANLAYRVDSARELDEQVSPPNLLKFLTEQTWKSNQKLKSIDNHSADQSSKLNSLATDLTEMLTTALQEVMSEHVGKPLQAMNEQLGNFQQDGLDVHRTAMEHVFAEFQKNFQSNLGDRFSELNDVLEKVIIWHNQTKESADQLLEAIREERREGAQLLERQRELFDEEHRHIERQQTFMEQQQKLALLRRAADAKFFKERHQEEIKLYVQRVQIETKLNTLFVQFQEQFKASIEDQQTSLAAIEGMIQAIEKISQSAPEQLNSILVTAQDQLRSGLESTFSHFDSSTSEIVDHLSGSYVQMNDVLIKLHDEVCALHNVSLTASPKNLITDEPKKPNSKPERSPAPVAGAE